MKPGIVADEMFPEGTSAIMDMDDEVVKQYSYILLLNYMHL